MPTIIRKYLATEIHGACMLSPTAQYIAEIPVGVIQDGGHVFITKSLTIPLSTNNSRTYILVIKRAYYGAGTIIHSNNKITNANQLICPPYTEYIRKKRACICGFKSTNTITVSVKILKKKKTCRNKDIIYSCWKIITILSYSEELSRILKEKDWNAFLEIIRERLLDSFCIDILRDALMEE